MSTVKIKTEPTAAAVDVKVKLEPSLSTADIKLEQHSSDIDTKVESNSEAESEEEDIKSESDDDDDDDDVSDDNRHINQNRRQYICKHPGCGHRFNYASNIKLHQHEHRIQTELNILGNTYTLTRQSLDDRWPCPVPNCTSAIKTVSSLCHHIRKTHCNTLKQQQQQQQQKPPSQISQRNYHFLNVDSFYVNDIRCGYHTTIGVFICYECRLVPECLLMHLQQKHRFDEKSIDNSALPDSAVTASADPNLNQHTANPHLAAATDQPYQQHHQDIVQGWLCVSSDCDYCGCTANGKSDHKKSMHHGEQISTIPALVLRLRLSKIHASHVLITRIDQASGAVTTSSNRRSQHKLDYTHDGLNNQGGNGDDTSQNETTDASNQRRQFVCNYDGCRRLFNSGGQLSVHRREHNNEVVINVHGTNYTLTRQSLDDRWPCPIPDCESMCKTARAIRFHILTTHSTLMKHKRTSSDDDDNQQQQQHQIIKKREYTIYYLKVDDFYISGTKCGYHTTTGLFFCYKCRLVPDCLLTHLQQGHGYDEKSIDNAILPKSAVNANADPNGNQHTNNAHLATAINRPSQLQDPDIIQGWLCVTSDCGYCHSTPKSRNHHQYMDHKGEQMSTAPALILRLLYSKAQTTYFLITRLDTTANENTKPANSASEYNNECNDEEDDGDEIVLSGMGDDDDDSS